MQRRDLSTPLSTAGRGDTHKDIHKVKVPAVARRYRRGMRSRPFRSVGIRGETGVSIPGLIPIVRRNDEANRILWRLTCQNGAPCGDKPPVFRFHVKHVHPPPNGRGPHHALGEERRWGRIRTGGAAPSVIHNVIHSRIHRPLLRAGAIATS